MVAELSILVQRGFEKTHEKLDLLLTENIHDRQEQLRSAVEAVSDAYTDILKGDFTQYRAVESILSPPLSSQHLAALPALPCF